MEKRDKFTPFTLKGKTAKNRFIRSATNSHLDNVDGMLLFTMASYNHHCGSEAIFLE